MTDPLTLDRAQRLLEARRRDLRIKSIEPPSFDFSVPTEWFVCEGCREELSGVPFKGDLCCQCALRPPEVPREVHLAAAKVPPRYRTGFEDLDPWPVSARSRIPVVEWSGDPWCIILAGDYGTGKSMLAAEMLWRLSRGKQPGRWYRASQLVSAWMGRDPDARKEAHALAKSSRVVVVDELARAHKADETWQALSDFAGQREEWERLTIWITNAPKQEIAGAEGSLWDRLRIGLQYALVGESRRRAAHE